MGIVCILVLAAVYDVILLAHGRGALTALEPQAGRGVAAGVRAGRGAVAAS